MAFGERRGDHLVDHRLANLLLSQLHAAVHVRMLRADHDCRDTGRCESFVFVRHLRLPIGLQPRYLFRLPGFRETLGQGVGRRDGCRHQLRGVVAGKAEHHALVPRPALVHTLGDLVRLGVQCDHAVVTVAVVSDLLHHIADKGRHIGKLGPGPDLAGHHQHPGRRQRLARHPSRRVPGQYCINDGVRYLVGDLVRMPFGDGFGGKEARAQRTDLQDGEGERRYVVKVVPAKRLPGWETVTQERFEPIVKSPAGTPGPAWSAGTRRKSAWPRLPWVPPEKPRRRHGPRRGGSCARSS